MPTIPFRFIALTAALLALVVVMLGAYTRLTNAGLGCPDWPGCYGHMVLPKADEARTAAQQRYPDQPLEAGKAWTEMVHRYAAGTLATLILFLAAYAGYQRMQGRQLPWKLPLLLVLLVVFQAALGMWTVTMKLLPVVVMGHLLGGIFIFSCLCRLALSWSKIAPAQLPQWQLGISLALVIVVLQIALGGWVSSNYAGISCIGFPRCNGQWLPALHFAQGFNLFSAVGVNYQGGLLDSEVRVTIQFVHRLGAVVTACYVSILSLLILRRVVQPSLRKMALMILLLVATQFVLGIINVTQLLPLWAAVLHNGVAALLAASLLMMLYLTQGKQQHGG